MKHWRNGDTHTHTHRAEAAAAAHTQKAGALPTTTSPQARRARRLACTLTAGGSRSIGERRDARRQRAQRARDDNDEANDEDTQRLFPRRRGQARAPSLFWPSR